MHRSLFISLLFLLLSGFSVTGTASGQASPEPQLHARERYAVRAGDVIAVEYRYSPEYNQTVTIQPDGFVNLQILGDLRIAGLTLDQIRALLLERAATRLNNPEINVTLREFEKPYIVVAGEVEKPGRFDFYEKTTALQAVMLAGGFKGSAQQTTVYVFRKVNGDLAEVHKLNLKAINKTASLERDLALEPGDMILVPRNKIENIARFVKATNLGLYFNPLTY